jgi:hypothetical protein
MATWPAPESSAPEAGDPSAGPGPEGVPLFSGFTEPYVLDLIEAQAYSDGAVLHIYRSAAG